MLIDGLTLTESSSVTNLVLPSGADFPTASIGELFYKTTGTTGVYYYDGSAWTIVASGNGYIHPTSGVVAGTYTKVTIDANGHVTSATTLSSSDVPALDWTKITTGKPTTLAGYGITDAANISGSTSQTFNTSSLNVSGSLLPTVTSMQDIGSPSLRWKSIYVDEALLSVNTLYLGDTPVMGTNANTIEIKADSDQSILVKTLGLGTSSMTSQRGINLTTSGTNADVVAQATGTGSKVRLTADNSVELTGSSVVLTSSTVTTSGNHSVTGNLTVTGNMTVNGTNTVVNSTTVVARDNIMTLNYGELGSGVTSGLSGLQIDRGDLTDYQIAFDESDDMFKVGQVGQLQTIASQTWVSTGYTPLSHVGSNGASHAVATTGSAGFMSSTDKAKLDGISSGANSYTHPTSGVAAGTYKSVTVDVNGHIIAGTNPSTLSGYGISDAVASSMLGAANGVATLDASGKIPSGNLPDLAITDTFVIANEVSMLALTAQIGDVAVRTDLNKSFILKTAGASTLANWQELLTPTSAVTSVNGSTGAVTVSTITGNAGTATALQTARSISATGDASWSVASFDGSANVTAALTLASVGTAGTYNSVTVDGKGRVTAGTSNAYLTANQTVTLSGDVSGSGTTSINATLANAGTAGTYTKVTTDAKGRVTAGASLVASDIPSLDWAKITSGKPTNVSGYGITDAYTKTEVDGLVTGLDFKASVRATTTANITLSGTQTIDGVAVIAGNRVLVKNQVTASQNGIYTVAAGAWTRSTDADNTPSGEVTPGMYCFVEEGTVNADSGWVLTTNGTIVLGTTGLAFTQFNGLGQVTAGTGIAKSGNTLSLASGVAATGTYNSVTVDTYGRVTAGNNNPYLTVNETITVSGDATGSGTSSIALTLANSGVSANTYGGNNSIPSLTVDAKGRVTAASAVTPSGTWGINVSGSSASCTGNAATASTSTSVSGGSIVSGVQPNLVGSAGGSNVQFMGDATNPAVISFHRSGTYAINMGLDTDNVFRLGGWSNGTNVYRWTTDSTGNFVASGNVTAYSDERVKANWRPLTDGFLDKLAAVKSGVYDRTDVVATQVGVSAQSLRDVLPEAVLEDTDGHLSVAYGNAALVACIALAKEVQELRAKIAELEAK